MDSPPSAASIAHSNAFRPWTFWNGPLVFYMPLPPWYYLRIFKFHLISWSVWSSFTSEKNFPKSPWTSESSLAKASVSWSLFSLYQVVLECPVCRSKKKRLKLNCSGPIKTRLVVYSIFRFEKYSGTNKKWFRLVATSLLSHYTLDLTHTHISFIFGPWIIKSSQELVEIWPKTFL